MIIMTDSMYVATGVTQGRHKWKARAWYKNPGKGKWISNADLWQKVDTALRDRKEDVKVQWVKGHAMPHHIEMKLTTEENVWGNNMADEIAGMAAEETEIGGRDGIVV